jgi:hypothetical protein
MEATFSAAALDIRPYDDLYTRSLTSMMINSMEIDLKLTDNYTLELILSALK